MLKGTEFIKWEHFDLGINLNLYERSFRIIDCDEFTQRYIALLYFNIFSNGQPNRFYADMGVKLNNPE